MPRKVAGSSPKRPQHVVNGGPCAFEALGERHDFREVVAAFDGGNSGDNRLQPTTRHDIVFDLFDERRVAYVLRQGFTGLGDIKAKPRVGLLSYLKNFLGHWLACDKQVQSGAEGCILPLLALLLLRLVSVDDGLT